MLKLPFSFLILQNETREALKSDGSEQDPVSIDMILKAYLIIIDKK